MLTAIDGKSLSFMTSPGAGECDAPLRRWHEKCGMVMNPFPAMTAIDLSHELEELEALFANPATCRDSCHTVTNRVIHLAALGHAKAILEILQRTSEKALFMPLSEGLRLHLGLAIGSTGAARAMALFVAERIRRETNHPFGSPSPV